MVTRVRMTDPNIIPPWDTTVIPAPRRQPPVQMVSTTTQGPPPQATYIADQGAHDRMQRAYDEQAVRVDTSPLRSGYVPWGNAVEGLARVGQAGLAGYFGNKLEQKQQAANETTARQLAGLFGLGSQGPDGKGMMGGANVNMLEMLKNPATRDLAVARMQSEWKAKNPGPTEYDRRAAAAKQYGLQEGSPEFQSFVLAGKMPGQDGSADRGLTPVPYYVTRPDGTRELRYGLPNRATGALDPLQMPEGGQIMSPGEKERDKVEGRGLGELSTNISKLEQGFVGLQDKTSVVVEDIDRLIGMIDQGADVAGFTGFFARNIPGSMSAKASALLDTIGANVAFKALEDMKKASPTGGALGQVTERELDLLKATAGSLAQSQDEAQLKYNLQRLRQQMVTAIARAQQQLRADLERVRRGEIGWSSLPASGGQQPPADGGGFSIRRID